MAVTHMVDVMPATCSLDRGNVCRVWSTAGGRLFLLTLLSRMRPQVLPFALVSGPRSPRLSIPFPLGPRRGAGTQGQCLEDESSRKRLQSCEAESTKEEAVTIEYGPLSSSSIAIVILSVSTWRCVTSCSLTSVVMLARPLLCCVSLLFLRSARAGPSEWERLAFGEPCLVGRVWLLGLGTSRSMRPREAPSPSEGNGDSHHVPKLKRRRLHPYPSRPPEPHAGNPRSRLCTSHFHGPARTSSSFEMSLYQTCPSAAAA